MPFVIDNRAELQGQPGLHAFIVGISAYPHLPKNSPTPASYNMQQLSSSAISAYKMCRWLLDRHKRLPDSLPARLATIRLLLAPSAEEVAAEQGLRELSDPSDPATHPVYSNFSVELKKWREDARSNKKNVTLFYFAGHGVQQPERPEGVLLLEDFLDGVGDDLNKTVRFNDIFYGMCPSHEQMARTQFFFVDACRNYPSQFKNYNPMTVPSIWNIEGNEAIDDRGAPVFYATLSGAEAYEIKNEQTLFSKALLKCLDGAAGEPMNEDIHGTVKWRVSYTSLHKVLNSHLNELADKPGADQRYTLGGWANGDDPTICFLDTPPQVDVTFELHPSDALGVVRIEILDDTNQPKQLPVPLHPHPFQCKLQAGSYRIGATIVSPNPIYKNLPSKSYPLFPPIQTWRRSVAL